MKSFALQITELNDGAVHSQLSADLSELMKAVGSMGRSGSLTLKIKVAPAVRSNSGGVEQVIVTTDRKLELPKPELPSDFFWLTDEGETSRQHPRQHNLPLRDVAAVPSTPIKSIDGDTGEIKFKDPNAGQPGAAAA